VDKNIMRDEYFEKLGGGVVVPPPPSDLEGRVKSLEDWAASYD
jgi:hypothetical protein